MRHYTKLFCFALMATLAFSLSEPAGRALAADSAQGGISVQDTINATISYHKGLKTIQENREAVAYELERAKRGYGPRVDINGAAGVSLLSNSTIRSYNEDEGFYFASRIGATLTQTIWDGFANRSRVRNAQATLDSMTNRVFDNANTLGLDALIAHIDVLRQREISVLTDANVARYEEILGQARDRTSMGADTVADVTQAESRLARALSTQVDVRSNLRKAEETYMRLTGMPAANLLPVPMPAPFYSDPSEVLDTAKKHNPKLLAYLDDIRAAKGNKELAQSAYHPLINLEAGPNYSDREKHGDQWVYSFDVMGVLRWNVFNSGQDVSEVKAADARIRQARQFAYDFSDEMTLEIENTWISMLSAQEQFKHYSDAVGFNTTTRDAYQEQFVLGSRSLLDVLDAEGELYNSATQAVTARDNVVIAAHRLLAVAGDMLPKLNIWTDNIYRQPEDTVPEDFREVFHVDQVKR